MEGQTPFTWPGGHPWPRAALLLIARHGMPVPGADLSIYLEARGSDSIALDLKAPGRQFVSPVEAGRAPGRWKRVATNSSRTGG